MLKCFVVDRKYFTIDLLNDRIVCFSYSTQEANDKPSPIKPQVVSSRGASLSQSCELRTSAYNDVNLILVLSLFSCTDVEPCYQLASYDW